MNFSFLKAVLLIVTMLWFTIIRAQNNDCFNAEIICSDDNIGTNPLGPGANDFADPDNFDGCLSGENQSGWYYFEIRPDAPPGLELGFIINPDAGAGQDYDFAVFGPDAPCDDLGLPIRCSYAGGGCAFCPQTGLGMGATDNSESPAGNGFVSTLTVNPGEGYYLLIDNFSNNSTGFSLTWTGTAAPFLNCINCDANAGTITANTSPACPGDDINYTITGYFDDPAYTQLILIADENGNFIDIITGDAGMLTSPDCATFTIYSYNYETAGGAFVPAIGDNISDLDCDVFCCDISELEVTFEDTEMPTFPNAPGDITVTCADLIPPLVDQEWQDNCDGSNLVAGTESGAADPCNGGAITRMWEYTDACGNTGTHEQTITVDPTPVADYINPPSDMTIACSAIPTGPGPDLAYTNNAAGTCEIAGMVSPTQSGSADVCGGTITYTWDTTDPCGRPINYVQTITVEPAPEATFITPPSDMTISCSDLGSLSAPDLSFTNNESGACEIAGVVSPSQTGSADECGGTITFTWDFTDACGRPLNHVQTITVEPTPEAAYISPPGNLTISCSDLPSLSAPDLDYTNNEFGSCELSGTIAPVQSGSADECGGTITFTWDFTDPCGRPINHVQTVTVDPAPEAAFTSLPGDFNVACTDFAGVVVPDLDYTNNESGACQIAGTISPTQSGSINECGGTITYTWSFTDNCGRTIDHQQNVTVEPAPEAVFIAPPADIIASCDNIPSVSAAELTYTNNETGSCAITGAISPVQDGFIDVCGGTITYTWEFTDNCGRTIDHVQSLVVTPGPEAAFIDLPADMTITCDNIPDNASLELGYDNGFTGTCEIFGQVQPTITGFAGVCGGNLTYTWNFTDPCGRSINHVQNLTVEPGPTPAFIDPPNNTTVACGDIPTGPGPDLLYDNGVVGACEQFGFVSPIRFGSADECGGTIIYQWSFTEDCGEVITHQQTITVEPAPDPIFINLPMDGSVSCGGIFTSPPDLEYTNGATGDCAIEGTTPAMVTTISSTEERYDWSFTSPCSGNTITYSQTITLDEAPDISQLPNQATICIGEDFDFTSVAVTDANNTSPIITYHSASPATPGNELPSLTISPSETTTYHILATNAGGCTDEQPFQLQVDPAPNAGTGSSGAVCFELANSVNLFSFISGTTDLSGQWVDIDGSGANLSNPNNVNLSTVSAGTYDFLYVVEAAGVCPNDAAIVTLELLPPISIDIPEITCSVDLMSYDIDIIGNGFTISSTGGGTLIDLGENQYSITGIPIANSVTITASNPIAAGCEQSFTVTSPDCNCPNTDPPVSNGSLSVCAGNPNPELSVNVGTDQTANWYTTATGGTPFLSASTTFTPTETLPGRYEYFVETEGITDGCTSALRTLIALDINDNPTGIDAELVVCDTDPDGLAAFDLNDASPLINSTPGLTFTYYDDLNEAQTGGTPLSTDYVNTTPISQDIFAVVSNSDGCTSIVTVTLTVNLPPVFTLDVVDESCPGSNDGTLMVGAAAGAMFSLDSTAWTFSNNFTDLSPGDYTIYVESSEGCFASEDFTVAPGLELLLDVFEVTCGNSGTPNDETDDVYTITFIVNNSRGVAGTYTVNNESMDWGSFSYGVSNTQTLPASGQAFTLSFIDDTLSCSIIQPVGPLESCSGNCLVSIDQLEFECFDNGSPTNPGDDFYTVTISASAFNGSASDTYAVLVDGNPTDVFTYGEVSSFTLPANGGSPVITVVDSDDPLCTFDQSIGPLDACSPDCDMGLTITNLLCNDAGTGTDPSDDTFSFDVVVTGANVSGSWTWVEDGFVGTYGDTFNFGPYPISGGDVPVTVRDLVNQTCPISLSAPAPAPCSDECEISITTLDIICEDSGTLSIQTDDFHTITIDAAVLNGGGTGNFSVFADGSSLGTFPYGTGGSFTLPADGSSPLIEVRDEGETACTASQTIGPLEPCTGPCTITADASNIICDDQGTNDPSDDTFTFTLIVDGENTSAGWQIQGDPSVNTFLSPILLGPFLIANGDILLNISDAENVNCSFLVQVTAPPSCSPSCSISSTVSNIVCNDEGTNDPSDDTFSFTAIITGENTAATWTATDGTTGTFGDAVTFGPFPIAGGDLFIDVEDDDNQGCITQLSVPAPATCSPTCAINITTLNVVCNDNGTLSIQNDDFYEITVNAAATDGGNTDNFVVIVDDVEVELFSYGQGGMITLPANGSTPTISVRDETETDCVASSPIGPLGPCTDACTIQAEVTNVRCDDQGTGNDSSDDTYSFDLRMTGQNTVGQWRSTDGALSGTFGETINAGPYLIASGNLSLIITDLDNPDCLVPFTVMAPEACSFCRQTVNAGQGATLTCAEPEAMLQATSSASGSYEWSLNGSVVSTELNTTTTIPGTYLFTASYPNGCVAIDSVVIENTSDIPEITQIEIIPEQCAGDNNGRIIIEEITGGQSPYDYTLNGANVNSAGFFTRLPPGDYNIVITDNNGCQTDTLITIEPGPDLKITEPLFLEVTQGDSGMVSVAVSVPEDELEYIQWTPPDQLSCDTCLTTRYLAEQSQNYILEVIHENGCIISTSLQILARRALEVYVPNVFSPNEDGVNDQITVFANNRVVEIESFQIFDRWGENLFAVSNIPPNNPNLGWDGRLNGKLINAQVLIYTTTLILDDGSRVVFKGDFVLMR